MGRDPSGDEEATDLAVVLEALDDEACRAISEHLEEPMTAHEISDAADVPLSTTYRKLDLLTGASLVEERTEIRADGHHTSRYVLDFEAVRIAFDENREFSVEIVRPPRTADERLEVLWSEVRKET